VACNQPKCTAPPACRVSANPLPVCFATALGQPLTHMSPAAWLSCTLQRTPKTATKVKEEKEAVTVTPKATRARTTRCAPVAGRRGSPALQSSCRPLPGIGTAAKGNL